MATHIHPEYCNGVSDLLEGAFKGTFDDLKGGELLGHQAQPDLFRDHKGATITCVEMDEGDPHLYYYDPELKIQGTHYKSTGKYNKYNPLWVLLPGQKLDPPTPQLKNVSAEAKAPLGLREIHAGFLDGKSIFEVVTVDEEYGKVTWRCEDGIWRSATEPITGAESWEMFDPEAHDADMPSGGDTAMIYELQIFQVVQACRNLFW
jgi:hypothetical protein